MSYIKIFYHNIEGKINEKLDLNHPYLLEVMKYEIILLCEIKMKLKKTNKIHENFTIIQNQCLHGQYGLLIGIRKKENRKISKIYESNNAISIYDNIHDIYIILIYIPWHTKYNKQSISKSNLVLDELIDIFE